MFSNYCALQGLQGHVRSHCYTSRSQVLDTPQPRTRKAIARSIRSVVVVDFRDEVYASIACMLEHQGYIIYQVKNTIELASKLVSKNPDLVLLNGSQPDENAWLTSAKLRTINASRPVWIYAPEPPSAIDEWLSMARTNDVIVYGGVLHRLLDQLRNRLLPGLAFTDVKPIETADNVGYRKAVA